jgi:glutamine amidotransferase
MAQKIVVVDYGIGNLHSVYKKLLQLKAEVLISQCQKTIANADKIILPGIGHFGKGMLNLKSLMLEDVLQEQVTVQKKPVLGICLGMQLMAKSSEEAPGEIGLGWLDNTVIRFHVPDPFRFKIPHIGWNQLRINKESGLLNGIMPSAAFYFSHSYHLGDADSSLVAAETEYGYPFVSAVEQENVFGVQFHPEKSHDEGLVIFQSFLDL